MTLPVLGKRKAPHVEVLRCVACLHGGGWSIFRCFRFRLNMCAYSAHTRGDKGIYVNMDLCPTAINVMFHAGMLPIAVPGKVVGHGEFTG